MQKGNLTAVEQLQEKPAEFLIVGIGASAGGIKALQEFFSHVPENSYMAYVVILHLSPDHDSELASLLQRETKMPVAQVLEKTQIKPNHVYVIPPDRHLMMDDGYIAVSPNLNIEDRRAPVDIFFRTLADQHGPRGVSVVLSGTGANGSMGLKRIKERGGASFVQNPREAEFNEMPRNAIATDLVDEVLNVADIPVKIISYKNNTGKVQIILESEQRPEEQQHALREIFTLLRHHTGHDFSNYKRPTLLRRIERRISVHNLPDLPAYARFLQQNADEPTALLKDLLISVTNFFRDKKAFETVEEEIIPKLVKGKNFDNQLRIWIAGCATGEEAYSFAMLCLEKTIGLIDAPKIQIFATDIDETAIAHARDGLYTINDLADVSQERLQRFFIKEADGYRVRREVRETIMFATHNFLKDPPFSHLDLVSCRNVMIYLNQVAQERVVETFHFALRPGCYLFLGNSESVDSASDLYVPYNRDHHIFQSRQVSPRSYPVPESTPALYFDKFKKDLSAQEQENKILERISFGDLHQQLLEEYAPPSLVVNEEYDILHLTEQAGKYLQISGGELSKNLLKLVKPELRLGLRSALYQAVQRQSAIETRGLKVTIDEHIETLNVQIRPVLRTGNVAKGFILIVFEPTTDDGEKEVVLSSNEPLARQLEEELIKVKAQLRAANEQHDFQAEEMKASNEELQAMNEELRSAAEELETSKEELQSINEELRTVNQELKVKIEETSIASNNLHNLINSTNIGTIFLDRSFRIVLFTPAVRNIFNLRTADYGRPLSDITGGLDYEGVLADAEHVLEKLVESETEVNTKKGSTYLMRISPYRTDEDRIKGVVITFLDITERRQAEIALRKNEENYRTKLEQDVQHRTAELSASKELLQATMDASMDMVQVFESVRDEYNEIVDFKYVLLNHEAEKWMPDVSVGKSLLELQPGVVQEGIFDAFKQVVETGISNQTERHYVHEQFDGWFFQSAVKLRDGVATTTTDITKRKKGETEILQLKDEIAQKATDKYYSLFNSINEGFCIIELIYNKPGKAIDYRFIEVNKAFEQHTGLKDIIGKRGSETTPGTESHWIENYDHVARTGEPLRFENYHKGTDRWYLASATRIGGMANRQIAIFFDDITQNKQQELRQAFLLKFSDVLRTLSDPVVIQEKAMQLLGKQTKVQRAFYSDLLEGSDTLIIGPGYANELAIVHGKVNFSEFDSDLLQQYIKGDTVVINDLYKDTNLSAKAKDAFNALNVCAAVGVPLVKNGKISAILNLHKSAPHKWTSAEIALFEDVAERTWEAVERSKSEKALKENQTWLDAQKQAFEIAMSSQSLAMALEPLVQTITSQTSGEAKGAFYSISQHLKALRLITGMTEDYAKDIDEFKAGPELIACRLAVKSGKPVIIPDVEEEPLWEPFREMAKKHHYRACWSFPLKTDGGPVLGTLAIYFEQPRKPLLRELEMANILAYTAAIIISRHNELEERKQAQQELENFNSRLEQQVADRTMELHKNYSLVQTIYDTTLIGMSVFAPVRDENGVITDFRILMVNKKVEKTTGRNDMVGQLYAELFPGIKQMGLFELMVKTVESGEPGKMEYHYNYEGINKWYSTMFVSGDDTLVSTNLDITDRKLSEEERFRNYVLLQQSEELTGMGSWDYDLITGNFTWSDGMYRMFDLKRGVNIRPEIYLQYATTECRNTAAKIVDLIKQGTAAFEHAISIFVKGTVHVLKIKATLINDKDGNPLRVLGVDMDVTATRAAEEKLRQLEAAQQLEIFRVTLRTQEDERRRISESLHNGLGQLLYGIKMSLSQLSIQQATLNPKEFEISRHYTSTLLSDAIRDSRRISHELMPAVLEEFGLKAAVNDICHQVHEGIIFDCAIDVEEGEIDKYMQLAVFRTLQELMLNVIKHAQATEAKLKLHIENGYIVLSVNDNGRGIDASKKGKNGIGLTSIRSKVNLLNGTIVIDSAAGEGTRIDIHIPYVKEDKNSDGN